MKENLNQKTRHHERWRHLLISALLTMIVFCGQAQTVQISGIVTDASSNEPIPGASVYVKGTQNGTVTNIDGKFSLNIKEGDEILAISFVGYKPLEVPIIGKTYFTISLEPSTQNIDEIVVTALSLKKEKKSLTYSVSDVKSDDLKNSKETNIISSLSGKVAGVNISTSGAMAGNAAHIVIRGTNSLNYSQPLIIVDGVPYANEQFRSVLNKRADDDDGVGRGSGNSTMADIDPNNIESVTVLKGAASSAMYGARGANGVILITTKSGKNNSKPEITFSHSSSWDKVIEIPLQNKYTQGTQNADGTWQYINGDLAKTQLTFGPAFSAADSLQNKLFDKYSLFNTGYTMENSVSIKGGTEKATYFLSYTNYDNQGYLNAITYKRNNFTTNFSYKVTDKLNVNSSFQYTHIDNTRLPEGWAAESFMNTFLNSPQSWNPFPIYDKNGKVRTYRSPWRDPYGWTLTNTADNSVRHHFVPTLGFDYEILKGLKLIGKMGIDNYTNISKSYLNQSSICTPGGKYGEETNTNFTFNSDIMLNYDKQIGDFQVNALLGNNVYSTKSTWAGVAGSQLMFPNLYTLDNVITKTPNFGYNQKRSMSFYGQTVVSWKNMLYATITGRNDWTSTLSSKNRSYFYPSVSLAFIVTELMPKLKFLNFAKVRASYTEVGNDMWAYGGVQKWEKVTVGVVEFPFDGVGGVIPKTTAPNNDLVNELTKEYELGLEFKAFQNRFGGEFSYYNKQTTNQIITARLLQTTGYFDKEMNFGRIDNKGIEVMFYGSPIKTKDFEWNVSLTYSKNKSEVVEISPSLTQLDLYYNRYAIKGSPYPMIVGTDYVRDANGNPVVRDETMDRTGQYLKDETGNKPIGKVEPDWRAGFRNTFIYKNLTISALIDMQKGGLTYDGSEGYRIGAGTSTFTLDRPVDGWVTLNGTKGHMENGVFVATGINTTRIRYMDYMQQNYMEGNFTNPGLVQPTDYIKLRELSITYTFTSENLKKMKYVKNIKVGFIGKNLWRKVHKDFRGADPEYCGMGDANAQGWVTFQFPSTKTYSVFLNFTF